MNAHPANPGPLLLDAVALTADLPQHGLRSGQVGTVVEALAPDVFEVEFADSSGRAYAIRPIHARHMLVLHYEPLAVTA